MDRIIMKNMAFHGNHGVLQEEKVLGQKFFVDCYLSLDLSKAGKNDDLNSTVSYSEVYDRIKVIMEEERYDLIEAVAERICSAVLVNHERVMKVEVTVRKPEAPVKGIFDYFGVEIARERV